MSIMRFEISKLRKSLSLSFLYVRIVVSNRGASAESEVTIRAKKVTG